MWTSNEALRGLGELRKARRVEVMERMKGTYKRREMGRVEFVPTVRKEGELRAKEAMERSWESTIGRVMGEGVEVVFVSKP